QGEESTLSNNKNYGIESYIIYAPLIAGMSTVMYEGTPICPDPGIWWKIVQDHQVTVMFSAPTAVRVLKKQDPSYLKKYDLSSLRYLFLAGEPLDEPTRRWIHQAIGRPVIDHYWQTESGWPILTAVPGIEEMPIKYGSPSFPAYGYNLKLLREADSEEARRGEKAVVAIVPPLPPGCLSTIWADDACLITTYFSSFGNTQVYSSFDWGIRDDDGYYFILGRTDDVINVAGHRLGTREIEEAVSTHANVAEVAVVGVADQIKGQVPIAFVVVKDVTKLSTREAIRIVEREVMDTVSKLLSVIGRPERVHFVSLLPKTRSGKMLRRSIQAIAEGRDPGDLTTLDDPSALEQIKKAIGTDI
ncbi:MAG: AMP-binding protein, partial [Pseudomonadota bacterium]